MDTPPTPSEPTDGGEPLGPIDAAPLIEVVEGHLLELLRGLTPEDWDKRTAVPGWTVRDVVCHLLDTELRKLSMARDRHAPERPDIRSNEDVVAFVNGLNASGVAFYRRLSSPVLVSLMEAASAESARYHEQLDPFAPAAFAVSWAGEDRSPNWFDTARELTERWHHQQQIRDAVGRPGIMTRELYGPVVDCFMRALPHHYRSVAAPTGSLAVFTVSGDAGGRWYLYRGSEAWALVAREAGRLVSETTIPQEIAWRLFTKGIERESARARVTVVGDAVIGLHVLGMLAIVG
jgi:uncharacterized protein (TIGR03083 family)